MKLTNLFIFLLIAINCFSQKSTSLVTGSITSFNGSIADVHIINLKTEQGMVSDETGNFKMYLAVDDVLYISTVQFNNERIQITEEHINSEQIDIFLIPKVNELKEIFITNLTGSLSVDYLNIPEDPTPKHNFSLTPEDIKAIAAGGSWGHHASPNAENFTNPIQMSGFGIGLGIPDKGVMSKQQLRKALSLKKQFPIKLIQKLGTDFFTIELKISEDKIHHFISYCETRNIMKLFYENKMLDLITILIEEGKKYHEIQG